MSYSPAATEVDCMRLLEARTRPAALPPVQVIAVTGGKGGTGKSSVAVNLATALAQAGGARCCSMAIWVSPTSMCCSA